MPRTVEWSDAAERDLRRVDHQARERIRRAVARLGSSDQGDVKRLSGREQEWRLRVGDWRVFFTLPDRPDGVVIFVLRVLPRGRAYRD